MNIRIQVMANQARQAIQQVSGDLTRMAGSAAAGAAGASGAANKVSAMGAALTKSGSQIQWMGRQLTYNLTIPLALAGTAATKFAMDNEAAMVRMQKVYGDASMSTAQMKNETAALGRTFEVLSEKYGIARDQTIGIAADWAAAGSSGLALAKQTELTMQTMVLGELDATTATQALIAIQAQYNQSSSELGDTIARLNNVENQTGTTMGDLIQSMSRSAGVARASGVDVAHLAAMTAALVPAAGSASQAGNSLKTMMSRLLSPTKDAMDILGAMNIHITDASWKSADAATRIEMLATHFGNLSDAQKQVVSATLASRYQINKFDVLMDAINNKTSYYWKALDAASNRTQYLAQVQKELNMVLDSSPKKMDRIKVILQNTLADAIQPILPAIISFAGFVANLAKRFNELSPNTQKLIIEFLLFLAVLGPIISKIGALKILLGVIFDGFGFVLKILAPVVGMLWGLGAAIAGVAWDGFIGAMGIAADGLGLLATGMTYVLGAMFAAVSGVAVFAVNFVRAMGVDAILTIWRYLWTQMAFFTGASLSLISGTVVRVFRGLPAMMMDALSVLGGVVVKGLQFIVFGSFALLQPFADGLVIFFSRLGFLIEEAFFGSLVVMMTLWRRFTMGLQMIMAASGPILLSAWQLVGSALVAAWDAVLFAITYVTTVWGPKLSAVMTGVGTMLSTVWSMVMRALVIVQEAAGTVMWAVWSAIQTGLAAITAAGGAIMSAIMTGFGIGWLNIFRAIGSGMMSLMGVAWRGIWALTRVGAGLMMSAMSTIGPMLLTALTNPFVLAAVAIAIALYAMRDKLVGIWHSIVKFFDDMGQNILNAFFALPKGVQGAMLAVVDVVKTAAMKVYDLFSYINPFAHHSPSLVENVQGGIGEVHKHFGTLPEIAAPIGEAYTHIANFKGAAADMSSGYDSIKTSNEVNSLSKAGAPASVIASYVALAAQLAKVKAIQEQYKNALDAQQSVVDSWQKSLDSANKVLDEQKKKLQDLQNVANGYKDAMSTMQTHLQSLATAPLVGMKAMDDAIFTNQQAQKQLQLQIALMTRDASGGYQSVADHVAALNGEIEKLNSQKTDLRALGAGSEITGVIDAQIKGLEDQKKTLNQSADEVGNLNTQLATLQSQANIMDLQKSLQFDGLTRSIDQAANGMAELPFDQVMAGILSDKAGLADLQTQYDAATAAVNDQQKAVDSAQASVDSIQASYDAANQSLKDIKDSYDQVTQAVQDMTSAMSDAQSIASGLSAAKTASAGSLSPTMQAFDAGAGGNFPDVGGSGMLGREGGAGDQSAQIDAMTKDLQKKMGDAFGGFDMFKPFKDMWNKFVKWWDATAWPFIQGIGTLFGSIFSGVDLGAGFDNMLGGVDWKGIFSKAWDLISNIVSTIWDFATLIWKFIGPDVKDILDQVVGFFKTMGDKIGGVWGDIKDRIGPFLDALQNLWEFAKPFLAFWVGEFVVAIIFAFKLLKNIVGPVLTFIGDMFSALWEIVRGILDLFIGIFTGDWQRVWDGFLSIFKGVWDVFLAILKGIGGLIWGVIKSVFETLVAIGSYLISGIAMGISQAWDALMSWIGGLWNGFIDWIKNILGIHSPSTVMAEIGGFLIQGFLDGIKAIWSTVVDFIQGALTGLGAVFSWLYNNIVKPIGAAIGAVFSWLYDNVIKPVIDLIVGYLNGWATVLSWLWNSIAQPIFGLIGAGFNVLGTGIQWVYQNIIKPAWDALGTAANWLWNNVLKPIWDALGAAWDALGRGLGWVYDHIIKPIFDAFGTIVGALKGTFDTVVTAIKSTWDTLVDVLKTPIRIAFDFVNSNMIDPVNSILSKFPGDLKIPHLPQLADGGLLQGPGNGRSDSIMAVDKLGIPIARVSDGEFVINERSTKANLDLIMAINAANGRLPGFAGGGILGGIGGAASWAWDKTTEAASWVGGKVSDLVAKGGHYAVEHLIKPLVDGAKDLIGPDTNIVRHMLRGGIDRLYGAIDFKGGEYDDAQKKAAASFGGPAQVEQWRGTVEQVLRELGQSLDATNAVLTIIQHESGGNAAAINLWDSNAKAGHPSQGLMQTIPGTFAAYAGPYVGRGITDGLANIYAGVNYGIHRYGSVNSIPGIKSLMAGGPYIGYDNGGIWKSGTVGINMSGADERVLTAAETAMFEKLVATLHDVNMPALQARLDGSQASSAPVTYNTTGDTINISINGGLSFPGINNGRDAETFLRNLADMSGGNRR